MISQVGLRRKLLSIALITLAVICPSLARAQATGVSPQNAKYDHGLRHFYWLYLYDAPGHQRRDWYQESSVTWNEIYEDGRYNHSRIVDAHASVIKMPTAPTLNGFEYSSQEPQVGITLHNSPKFVVPRRKPQPTLRQPAERKRHQAPHH